jgi:spermidine synthase
MSTTRALKAQAMLLGVAATIWQILLLREFMAIFYGNELIIGLLLSEWLLFIALGCWVGDRRPVPTFSLTRLSLGYLLSIWLIYLCTKHVRLLLKVPVGEFISLPQILLFAMPCLGVPCLLLGFWFSRLSTQMAKIRTTNPSAVVYIYESVGAAAAGLLFTFGLVKWFSDFFSLIALSLLLLVSIAFLQQKHRFYLVALGLLVIAGYSGEKIDHFLSSRYWQSMAPGIQLQASQTSRYGAWAILDWGGEKCLYCNGLKQTGLPDPIGTQAMAAIILTQHPFSKNILLIGGGFGGLAQELGKSEAVNMTYVELDATAFRMVESYGKSSWNVKTIFQDGRRFLRQNPIRYDLIVINAGRPTTALNNRFYTREFYQLAEQRLMPGGVLALCGVPCGENVVGPELLRLNSALYQDLAAFFTDVLVLPGEQACYFACNTASTLCADPDSLSHRYHMLQRQDIFFHPQMFRSLFLAERRINLTESLKRTASSNSDFKPISYYLDLEIWLKQVSGFSASTTTCHPQWLMPGLLAGCFIIMMMAWLKKSTATGVLLIMFLSGFLSISMNIIFLLMLQTIHGYVYEGMGLAMAAYMAGMSFSAYLINRVRPAPSPRLPLLFIATMLFLLLLMPAFRMFIDKTSLTFFIAVLGIGGMLSGAVFPLLNKMYMEHDSGNRNGRVYSADLLGAGIGSVLVNTIAIPSLGFAASLYWLTGFCGLAVLGSIMIVNGKMR